MARSQVKFTPDVVDQIVAAVLAGNYVSTASAAAGIHRATYYSWMKRGEQALPMLERTPSLVDYRR